MRLVLLPLFGRVAVDRLSNRLGHPVSKYLPQFKGQKNWRDGDLVAPKMELTIEQLMTHTARLTYGFYTDHPVEAAYREVVSLNSSDLAEFIARLSEISLRYEPGSRYHYSVATDVWGALIESISAQSLDNFFEERIFGPLEMNDTFFNIPNDELQRLANNHFWNAEENSQREDSSSPMSVTRDSFDCQRDVRSPILFADKAKKPIRCGPHTAVKQHVFVAAATGQMLQRSRESI